jgi:GNAT superfamily N-acetyltransferase
VDLSSIAVRQLSGATPQAAAELNALIPQLTSRTVAPMTTDRLQSLLDSGTILMVAEDNAHIVAVGALGFVHQVVGTKCWIEDVVVDQAYRGQGIAGRLMEALLAVVPAGAYNVNLTSKAERPEAQAWYERLGLVPASTVFRLKR